MTRLDLMSFLLGAVSVFVAPWVTYAAWALLERVWLYASTPAPREGLMVHDFGGVYRVYYVEHEWLWWTAEMEVFYRLYRDGTYTLEPNLDAGEHARHLDPRRLRRMKPYTPPELAPILDRAGVS